MAQINLGVALNFDDSQYKSGVKSVEQSLKKFSTTPAFVKLKLDDTDFRKQYQDILADLQKKVQKTGALNYKTTKGKAKVADSIGTIQSAYKYNLEQSQNTKLSTAEINTYKKREEVLRQYLNLLKLIGEETKRNAQLEKERANMGVRMEKARMTAKVAAERQRAYKAEFADEREAKKADELFRRRWAHEFQQWNKNDAELAKLQREADARARAAAGEYNRQLNRVARGGNTSSELADMRRYYQQQEQASRRAVQENKRLEHTLLNQGSILGRLKGLASRYFSIYTVINFGKKVAEVTGYFQQQQVALEGILGSASEAKKLLNEITSFALTSPFQTKELVQFTKQLAAFGVKENLFEKVKELADISTGLGVGMDRIILAYGQVKSATVLRGQELRQFTEAGIPMVEALAKKFTALNGEVVRTSEIFEMISKRQVSFDVVAEVLSDMTKEGGQFYKMQENITNTMYGQMQKLRDLWTLAMNDIGKSSGGVLNIIIKLLQQMVIHGKSIAIAIGAAFAGNAITKAIVGFNLLNNKVKAYIRLLRMSAKARTLAFGGAAGVAIGVVTGLISKAVVEANKLRKAFEEIEDSFAKENSRMIEGLDSLTRKITSAKVGTKEYAEAVDTLAQNYGDFISNDLIKKLKDQEGAAYDTARAFGEIAENVKEAIKEYNNYKEIVEKKKAAQDNVWSNSVFGSFRSFMGQSENWGQFFSLLKGGFRDIYERDADRTEIKEFDKKIYQESINRYITSDDLSDENFKKIIKDVYTEKLPNQLIPEDLLNEIADTGLNALKLNHTAQQAIQKIRDLDKEMKNTEYYGMFGYFNSVDPSKTAYDNSDRIDYQNNREAVYLDALFNTLSDRFKTLIPAIEVEVSDEQREGYRDFAEQFFGVTDSDKINPIVDKLIERYVGPATDRNRLDYLTSVLEEYVSNGGEDQEYIERLKQQIAFLELTSKLAESYTKEGGLIKTLEFNNNTVSEINNLLSKFRETFGNDSEAIAWLNKVQQEFNKHVETKTGRAAEVSDLMENHTFYRFTVTDEAVKALWMQLIPDDLNYEDKRKSVATQLSEKQNELKEYRTRTDKDEKYIKTLELQIEALELLASADYYNIKTKEETKAKNRYERLRITDFFAEMLSLIKKAEDATEKIVGVTGYTEQLNTFVDELGEGNFLKEFFVKGGNPFKKLMDEFKDYGVTEFLPDVNEEKLKTIFRQAGWEEGKEFSVPDFQAMYKQAIEVLGAELLESLKAKANALPDGAEKNSINSAIKQLQERVVSATKELETRWGDQEIESKLLEMIKGLTDINSNLTKIREKNDLFERVARASNYSTAQEAIYGKDSKYKPFVGSGYTSDAILQMLQSEGGQGIAGTNAGTQLKALLEGGNLNISNLTQLVDIMHDLEEQAAVMSVTAETDEAKRNAEQFKKVTGQFSEQIKKLCDDIINELEALKAARTEGMVGRDKIDTANTNYKDSMTAIENALSNGTIKAKDADKMKLQATQNLYNELLGALGGEGMPQWAMNLFGDKDSLSGISDLGKTLNSMFGGRSLQDLVSQGIADKYQAGEFGEAGSEEAMLAAGEAASSAASAIAITDMIIKAIYELLSFATKLGTQIIDWMEKTNDVTSTIVEKADGTFKKISSASDFDYTNDMQTSHTEKYDSDKLARQKAALQAAQTFNQHVMDGWEKLKSGDVLGAVFETIASIGDLIVDIFGISDSTREATIQNYLHDIDRMGKALDTLDFRASFMSGLEALDEQSKKLDVLREQQEAYEKSWNEENAKRSSSQEKLDEYQDGATEKFREQLELIKSMQEGIMGTADALADNLSNALVNAFKQGKNAAREWKDALKSYIGEVMQQMLINKVFGTQLDKLMDQWMYGFTDSYDSEGNLITAQQKAAEKYGEQTDEVMAERLGDSKLAKQFYKSGIELGDYLIEYIEGLPEDAKNFMFGTTGTTALSGGISGITEDTARQLEGLNNSMLIQLITISQYLSYMSNSGFAQVQVSWFNDMLSQTRAIKTATEGVYKAISDMRNGTRPMSVVIAQ
jgi:tape measure domain-containing protein